MSGAAAWAGGEGRLPLSKPQATRDATTMEVDGGGTAAWGQSDDKEAAREVESSHVHHAPPDARAGCGGTMLQFMRFIGPGMLMCIAFLDPGNLAADVNSGVQGGYTLLWVTTSGTVVAWAVQCLAAKLGIATGSHLAVVVRERYPRPAAWFLFAAITAAVLATDMLEVVGGAIAITGLSRGAIPLWGGVLICCATTILLLQLQSAGARLFESLMAVLVSVLGASMAALFFSSGADYAAAARGMFVPALNARTITLAVGNLGALCMPHNFYLHSTVGMTREAFLRSAGAARTERFAAVEAALCLALSCAINIFCTGVFAHGFEEYAAGAGLGLANIGQALGARFAAPFEYVWYAGLLASAQASTLTTSYTGQFIIAGFFGLDGERWWHRHLPRAISLAPALIIAGLSPRVDDGFAALTNWLNNINGLVIPFVLLPLLVLTADGAVMGARRCARWHTAALTLVCATILGLNAFNLLTIPGPNGEDWGAGPTHVWYAFMAAYVAAALFFATPPRLMRRAAGLLARCCVRGGGGVAGAGGGAGGTTSSGAAAGALSLDSAASQRDVAIAGVSAGPSSKDVDALPFGEEAAASTVVLPTCHGGGGGSGSSGGDGAGASSSSSQGKRPPMFALSAPHRHRRGPHWLASVLQA